MTALSATRGGGCVRATGPITITVAFPFTCTATITGSITVDDHDHVDDLSAT